METKYLSIYGGVIFTSIFQVLFYFSLIVVIPAFDILDKKLGDGELYTIARQQLSSMKYYSLTSFSTMLYILSIDIKTVSSRKSSK